MAFAAVSSNAVWLLKALSAHLTGEAQRGCCLHMLAPVPVQGGLLAASETADLAPEAETVGTGRGLSCCAGVPSPPHHHHHHHLSTNSLQGLLSSVNAPVDEKVAASAERPGTELTDVVPGVCVSWGHPNIHPQCGHSWPSNSPPAIQPAYTTRPA